MSTPTSTSAVCARGRSERGVAVRERMLEHDDELISGIRPPDAIQLACAAQVGVDLFITNDDRLSRLTIPGIQFLVPLARAFL